MGEVLAGRDGVTACAGSPADTERSGGIGPDRGFDIGGCVVVCIGD